VSGYWLAIVPAAAAAMSAVVYFSRRLAYHPAHARGAWQPGPPSADVGSMILADETAALADGTGQPARLGTWFPHADTWGLPADEWTTKLLRDLHNAPTVLDNADQLGQLEEEAGMAFGAWCPAPPPEPEPERVPAAAAADLVRWGAPGTLEEAVAAVRLAADVDRHRDVQDTGAVLYQARLAEWGESYLADLRESL